MSEDLRTAYEMEALIVKQHGLLISDFCDCRFRVLASYPGRPWYFVHLACDHALRKVNAKIGRPETYLGDGRICTWVTGAGCSVR